MASLLTGGGVSGETMELFPKNPKRGEFCIVRIVPCAPEAELEIRVGNGTRFPVLEVLPTGCVGFIAVPLMGSEETVLELLRNGRTVRRMSLRFAPVKAVAVSPVTVSSEFVSPPKGLSERIEREAVLLASAKSDWTNIRFFGNIPVMPVANGRIGSLFGETRKFNGRKDSVHWGTDIAGAPALVCSVFPGKVILSTNLYFAGNTVLIEHGYGLVTQYSHMAEVAVREGDFVAGGAVLGRMGMTGRATGPHLHWSAYVKGVPVDPLTVLSNCRKFPFD